MDRVPAWSEHGTALVHKADSYVVGLLPARLHDRHDAAMDVEFDRLVIVHVDEISDT